MGDISAQSIRQLSFLRMVERGDMPPGWSAGREAPIAHRERAGHRLAICEDDDNTVRIICEECMYWWLVGRKAHMVQEVNIRWADKFYRAGNGE